MKIKWLEIGIQLGIDLSELRCFEMSHTVPNPLFLLTDVLSYWINEHTDVPVTWESLVIVLKSASVDEKVLAGKIQSKYCQVNTESKTNGGTVCEGEACMKAVAIGKPSCRQCSS